MGRENDIWSQTPKKRAANPTREVPFTLEPMINASGVCDHPKTGGEKNTPLRKANQYGNESSGRGGGNRAGAQAEAGAKGLPTRTAVKEKKYPKANHKLWNVDYDRGSNQRLGPAGKRDERRRNLLYRY